MGSFLLLYILVLGYLSFTELFWLPCHVRVFEESSQVRWCSGDSVFWLLGLLGTLKGRF